MIPRGLEAAVGIGYSVTAPPGALRPILLAADSVNQTAPSDPSVMPVGLLLAVLVRNPEIVPVLVTMLILLVFWSTK